MRGLSRQNSWLRTSCKIAALAAVVGFALLPRASAAAAACPRFCPQYLAEYCVLEPDGQISTVWTNPCFACHQHIRILYAGACKIWIGIPRTCKGTTCS
jgi:hypothetical protein